MPLETPPAELDALWRRITDDLRGSLPASTFKLWLEPLHLVSAQGSTLYLSAPDSVRSWVERRYLGTLLEALGRQTTELTQIVLVDVAEGARTDLPAADPASLPVDPSHTFDRFVIGPGNRLAHAAALAVAELPGDAYNPLFLHGPPGLGKTHLLGAIADYLRRNHRELTVHYTTAERFTTEFVAALRHEGPQGFKARYRELDALLIDDVQVLEGKQRTEEEFVHTFNALHAAGKQIVLSSDRPPQALSQLAERLRDRFLWGLCVDLDAPDLRTRVALLWRIASDAATELPDPAVLREIASRAPGNVRRLEGAMTRVLAFASMLSEPLSPGIVDQALERRGSRPPGDDVGDVPSLQAIQEAVSTVLGIPISELLSGRRAPRVAQARQLAMYLGRELTPSSLSEIARAFDRDHTTVLHAVRAVSGRLEPGSDTQTTVHRVRRVLGDQGDHQPDSSPSSTASTSLPSAHPHAVQPASKEDPP